MGNEGVQLLACETVVSGFGKEHSASLAFGTTFEETEVLYFPPEPPDRLPREPPPQSSRSFVDPEDSLNTTDQGEMEKTTES